MIHVDGNFQDELGVPLWLAKCMFQLAQNRPVPHQMTSREKNGKKTKSIGLGAWSLRGPCVVIIDFAVELLNFAVVMLNFAVVPKPPKNHKKVKKTHLLVFFRQGYIFLKAHGWFYILVAHGDYRYHRTRSYKIRLCTVTIILRLM